MSHTYTRPPVLFGDKGEMAALIDQFNWTNSPLGLREFWPKSLQHTVDLLLNSAFPMFLLWGPDYTSFYNDAFRQALGHGGKHPVTLGQPGHLIWNEIWPSIEPLINAVMEGHSAGSLEDQHIPMNRNGKMDDTYWTLSCNPVKNDSGQVEGVLAICLETTNRVNQNKATDLLHEQLALALEACDLGTWDLDPNTMLFKCNEKTKEIFGLAGNSNVNLQTAVEVIEPGERPRIKEAIAKALDIHSGGRYHVEYTVIHPHTNEHRIVRAKGKVFFNDSGKPEKFTGTVQDITEERLSSSGKEKLHQLVENSTDFMSMATLDGVMTYMNPAGRKLIGLGLDDELSTFRINDFYEEAQFELIKTEVIPSMNQEGQWSGVVKIKHQVTGEEIPCQGNYILVKDPVTGKVISRAATLRDLRPDLQARNELLESEKRFRNLVQQAPVATSIYVGKEMRIQWANDAMIKLWGKDKSVVGKTIREALPELEDQPFHQQLDQVYTTGEMYQATEDKGEIEVDGQLQTFYFNFSYKPLRDAQGNVYGILNMAIDVTEMVVNKRRVQESEKAFRNLIMQAPVGICLLKGDSFIVDIANEQYAGLVGRSLDELTDRPIWKVLPEAKAQGFDVLLEGVKKTGTAYIGNEQSIELIRNGLPEIVYLNFVYEPLFDEKGDVESILVIAIDISQQVKLRHQVELLAERARLAVASGQLGTYEVNLLTGDVITSPRFDELFDVTGESRHHDYVAKIHPLDLPAREKAHELAMRSGILQYEARICRKDGSENWVQINGQVYHNEKGEPDEIIGIVQDISAQKNIEQELEKRVQERTAELVRVNEELQQFIFISSHDLKEPLRKIQLFGSLAKDQADPKNEKLLTSLNKVVASANRMTSLLNDLIHYSTLSDPNQPMEKIDLNTVLHTALDDLEVLIAEKGAVINAAHLPVVDGINFQLVRLFYNLVHNALKFSKPGQSPILSIQSRLLAETEQTSYGLGLETAYFKIDFQDNGVGFKPEFAEKIFVVFQQLQERNNVDGNGIGLAICKKVVENHKGKIYAISSVNHGAVFSILLPVNPAHANV